jgi:hypothetical protein
MKKSIVNLSRKLGVMALCVFYAMTCTATVLVIPDATITGLSHSFGHFYPAGPATEITDGAASGQFTLTSFTVMLTGSETVDWSFEAPVGEMFVIHTPPSGFNQVSLSMFCQWWGGSFDGMENPISTSFTFENLVGPAPVQTSSYDIMGTGGKLIQFSDSFSIAPGTTFTGVELSAQYDFSTVSPMSLQFNPQSFHFNASVTSPTETLGDGKLMTLETVPEPSSPALILILLSAFVWSHRFSRQPIATSKRKD